MSTPAPASPGPFRTTITTAAGAEANRGEWIGRYKLLQKIGEGGCGVVYLAEQQEPVVRRVALKVIKLGMDTKEVVARFEAERQALALMDHPNIARVFDGGATDTGRPFFVMELVRGVPITKFCDEHNLPTEARLELFTQVCHAVQHAHQKGIIHRDLKPSNILVALHDGKPTPKVIDFGIAKATTGRLTDHTLFTAVEHFIGTPAYISPEQAQRSAADVDTRSDVYSLGVLLYELLTGHTPFDTRVLLQRGIDALRQHLREVSAPRPSARLRALESGSLSAAARQRQTAPQKLIATLRSDLDWIVLRCLEPDRERRYASAASIADDLGHFLRHEPITARPPGTWYVLRKLARRNRVAAFGVSAVLAALTVGAALTIPPTLELIRLERDNAAAPARASEAVHGAVSMLSPVREQFDAWRQSGGIAAAETPPLAYLDALAQRTSGPATARPADAARWDGRLADAYVRLGALGPAQARAEQALTTALQHDVSSPDSAGAMRRLAIILGQRGEIQKAHDMLTRLIDLHARNREADREWFEAALRITRHFESRGQHAAIRSFWHEAIKARRQKFGDADDRVLLAMGMLAREYRNSGNDLKADPVLEHLAKHRTAFMSRTDKGRRLDALRDRVIVLLELEDRPRAAAVLKEWIRTKGRPELPYDTGHEKHSLALLLHQNGHRGLAEDALGAEVRNNSGSAQLFASTALAILRNESARADRFEARLLAGLDGPFTDDHMGGPGADEFRRMSPIPADLRRYEAYRSVYDLAEFHRQRGELAKEATFRAALDRAIRKAPKIGSTSAQIRPFVWLYRTTGHWAEAERLQRILLESVPPKDGEQHERAGFALSQIVDRCGRHLEAVKIQEDFIARRTARLGSEAIDVHWEQWRLGRYHMNAGQHEQAESLFSELLAENLRLRGKDSHLTTHIMEQLGFLQWKLKRLTEAEHTFSGLREIERSRLGADHPATLFVARVLGEVLRDQNRFDEAIALHRTGLETLLRVHGPLHRDAFFAFHALGIDFRRQQKWEEAVAVYTEASRTLPQNYHAWDLIGWLRATAPNPSVRHGPTALHAAQRACELSAWVVAACMDTLAAAHAENGDFERAVEFQRKAIALGSSDEAEQRRHEERLALYLERRAYRQPSSP